MRHVSLASGVASGVVGSVSDEAVGEHSFASVKVSLSGYYGVRLVVETAVRLWNWLIPLAAQGSDRG